MSKEKMIYFDLYCCQKRIIENLALIETLQNKVKMDKAGVERFEKMLEESKAKEAEKLEDTQRELKKELDRILNRPEVKPYAKLLKEHTTTLGGKIIADSVKELNDDVKTALKGIKEIRAIRVKSSSKKK